MKGNRTIKAPTGTNLSAKSWLTEATLRMIMNIILADRGIGVVGEVDPAVAGREHPRVGGAVVFRVKDDGVLVRVDPTRIERVVARPPIGRQPPVSPAVIGAEKVHAPGPDDVRIGLESLNSQIEVHNKSAAAGNDVPLLDVDALMSEWAARRRR